MMGVCVPVTGYTCGRENPKSFDEFREERFPESRATTLCRFTSFHIAESNPLSRSRVDRGNY
jgi:hypothetical protein